MILRLLIIAVVLLCEGCIVTPNTQWRNDPASCARWGGVWVPRRDGDDPEDAHCREILPLLEVGPGATIW